MSKVNERTTVSLSRENYNKLRQYGFAGESLNETLGHILAKVENSN